MASDKDLVEFIADQITDAGKSAYRKMFGEYAVYCDEKVVALVSDNKLFVKQTEGGKRFIKYAVQAPPYPGAKMSFLRQNRQDYRCLYRLREDRKQT